MPLVMHDTIGGNVNVVVRGIGDKTTRALELAGSHSFLGQLQIDDGLVVINGEGAGPAGVLADTTAVSFIGSKGLLETANKITFTASETIGGLNGTGTVVLGGQMTQTDVTFTVDSDVDNTFSGVFENKTPSNQTSFIKKGSGTFNYTGGQSSLSYMSLEGGNFVLNSLTPTAFKDTGFQLATGTLMTIHQSHQLRSLDGRGSLDILGGAQITVGDASSNRFSTFFGNISASDGNTDGMIKKIGASTWTLSGSNSYSGALQVDEGILRLGSANTFAAGVDVSVGANGTFQIFHNQSFASLNSDAGSSILVRQGSTVEIDGDSNDMEIAGVLSELKVSGSKKKSNLTKLGTGTLTLSGAGGLDGAITIHEGTLIVTGGKALSDKATINIGTNFLVAQSEEVGSISGFGVVTIDADQTLTLSGSDSTFTGKFKGAGHLEFTSGTHTTSASADQHTGNVYVKNSALVNNGSLGSTVVQSNAILSGNGSVDTLHINRDGTLSPGTGIGQKNVTKDVQFDTGSQYLAEVSANGDSDVLAVGGDAHLLGGVVVIAAGEAAEFAYQQTYEILNVQGKISGEFEAAWTVPELDYLTPELLMTGKTAQVQLTRNSKFYSVVANTANQRAVGRALTRDAVGSDGKLNAVSGAILTGEWASARIGLSELSGTVNASNISTVVIGVQNLMRVQMRGGKSLGATGNTTDASEFTYAALHDLRGREGNDVNAGTSNSIAGYKTGRLKASEHSWNGWVRGFGSTGSTGENSTGAAADFNTGGLAGGFEAALDNGSFLGMSFAYQSLSTDDTTVNASADTMLYSAALSYAGKRGDVDYNGLIGYAYGDVSSSRFVSPLGLSASADYGQNILYGGFETGMTRYHNGILVRPFASLQGAWIDQESYRETGAGSAGLVSAGETSGSLTSQIGVSVSREFAAGDLRIAPHASLAWSHEYLDVSPAGTYSFIGGATPFTVEGAARGRDALEIGFGAIARFSDTVSGNVAYETLLSNDSTEHFARAGLTIRW